MIALISLTATTAHAQGPASTANTIVFVVPQDLDASTRSALADALLTSLSLVGARLRIIDGPSTPESLPIEERVMTSKRLAAEQAAMGVLWLDVRLTDHWFLYAMDAEAERVVVRPLLVHPESVAAAIETVAVISRASAQALLRGEPVVGEPVVESAAPPLPAPAPSPAPPPPAPQPPQEPGRLRLSLGYAGGTFASAQPWQSGVHVGAAWMWHAGPFAALSFAWFPSHRFGDEPAFSIQRRPFTLGGGYALRASEALLLAGSLSATLDVQSRHTAQAPGIAAKGDTTRLLVAVAPDVTAELAVTPWLGAFLTLGGDVVLNDFDYVTTGAGGKDTVLDPFRVRMRLAAGLAIVR